MITMKVLGLTLDGSSNTPILVLQREDGDDVLPIWVGASEAMAISMAMNSMQLERPLTHALFLQAVTALGAEVTGVSITSLKSGTFFACVEFVRDQHCIQVDCRPSDGIALALRAQVPIRIAEDVLHKAAQDRVDPSSSEEDKRPSDMGDAIIRRAAGQIAGQVHGHRAGESFGKEDGQPHIGVMNVDSLTDESRLSELLQTLEPATRRIM